MQSYGTNVRRRKPETGFAKCFSSQPYSLSNSELPVNFNGKSMSSGAYTYLKSWLSSQAKEEIKVSRGAVKIVFDNEQVIGKRYTVKSSRNAVPLSVITSHVYISIDVDNSLKCYQN